MKQAGLRYIPYIVAGILFMIAALFDLEINTYLYAPQSVFGMFFERFILIPIIMVLPITCFAYYTLHQRRIVLLLYAGCCSYVILDLVHFWMPLSQVFIESLCASLLFMIVLFILLRQVPYSFWKQHERFLLFTSLVFVSAILTTFVWKQFWGRVRFREMYPDLSLFTPWYIPRGVTGHQSFPSGHTTAMSVLLCSLEYYKARGIKKRASVLQYLLVLLMILLMMLSRMIVGAHFLSDVTMGFTITYTYYLLYRKRFFREDFLS